MAEDAERRLRFALPFTVIAGEDRVHLVAGEDARFTLSGEGIAAWAPPVFAGLDGRTPLGALLSASGEHANAARKLIDRLLAERVVVDAALFESAEPIAHRPCVAGKGDLAERMRRALELAAGADSPSGPALRVVVQDTLDDPAVLSENRARLYDGTPWLWVSTGPLVRAYVGPVFLPRRGPCFGCLLAAFDRLSPVPDLRRVVREHAAEGGALSPSRLPEQAESILVELTRWKLSALRGPEVPPAVYRLHVLELGSFEISSYPVPVDPDCEAACSSPRGAHVSV